MGDRDKHELVGGAVFTMYTTTSTQHTTTSTSLVHTTFIPT
jgi:hypothetical protein